jgi:hypothetical protein
VREVDELLWWEMLRDLGVGDTAGSSYTRFRLTSGESDIDWRGRCAKALSSLFSVPSIKISSPSFSSAKSYTVSQTAYKGIRSP